MVTIINGFRQKSPIATGIENAANALFGPGRAQAATRQAQLERLQLQNDLDLAERASKEFAAGSLSPERGAALLGGVRGRDFANFQLSQAASDAAAGGGDLLGNRGLNAAQLGAGLSAGSTGVGFREGEANQTARSRMTANIAAATSRANQAARIEQAQREAAERIAFAREQAGNELVEVIGQGGQPMLVPRAQVNFQHQPILSETEQRGRFLGQNFENIDDLSLPQRTVLSAAPSETQVKGDVLSRAAEGFDPGTLPPTTVQNALGFESPKARRFQTPDGASFLSLDNGVTDFNSGQQIPANAVEMGTLSATSRADAGLQPSASNATEVFGNQGAIVDFLDLIEQTRGVAQDPTIFGLAGRTRAGLQGVRNLASSADLLFGGDGNFQREIESAQQTLLQPGNEEARNALVGLFDPNLDAIDRLAELLVFQGASALAGQEGRGLSDKDVAIFRRIIGDPKAFFGSQEKFLNGIAVMEQLARGRLARLQERQGGDFSGSAPLPQQDQVRRIKLDANGNPVQ